MLSRKQIKNNSETCEGEQVKKDKLLAQKRFEKTGGISTHVTITRLEKKGYVVLDLDEENCDELKEKAPSLYNKIYEQGKKEGRIEGKELAEISRKARLKAIETKNQTEVNLEEPKTLKEKYDNSKALQDEFGDFGVYEAYAKNEKEGKARILEKRSNVPA